LNVIWTNVADLQTLGFVGLWEVREQILNHDQCARWTISLGGAYAGLMRLKAAGTAVPDDLLVEIRDLEKKLPYRYNRQLARLLAMAFNDGFVVLLTEAMPSDFHGDWSTRCHRCESAKEKTYDNTIQYLCNNMQVLISVVAKRI
jgi:hypothetical protein